MQKIIIKFICLLILIYFGCEKKDTVNIEVVDVSEPAVNFFIAAKSGDYKEVKRQIEEGIDINRQDEIGETALMKATKERYIEIIEFLISKGADINIKNNYKKNALSLAIENNYPDVIEILKGAGATE